MDANQQEFRVDIITHDSRALLLDEILLATNPLEIEIEDEIELMPTNFDLTEDHSSHDRSNSLENLDLDILGSPDRSSRRHEFEDESPPRMNDLPGFDRDILGPNMPAKGESTSHTRSQSIGQTDSKSSNDIREFDANQLDQLDRMSLCSEELQPIPEEYRQWLMDPSPTLIQPPRKRRRRTKGSPENLSLLQPLLMANRSCAAPVMREYTRFVKAKVDRIAPVQSQNTASTGNKENVCAENGNEFEPNQFDFEMENGLLPNDMDMDLEFGNLNLDGVGNGGNGGSTKNPTVDFSHMDVNNERDGVEDENCSDIQTEGKSPGVDMEIDRLRTALGSGIQSGSFPLPGSIPRSNPGSAGVSWHSSMLGSSKTRSEGSQRITNLGPRLPGQLPTVQEASDQPEQDEEKACRSLLEETGKSDHGGAQDAINQNTVRVLRVLREKFAEEKSEGGGNPNLSFEGLCRNLNRVERARFFYQLLVCHANEFIRIEQLEPYGDLTLWPGDKL
ncbi:hypothetical protein BSKO_03848 [Bryopsis sp. KO-2023]|nr:hypothetical protein BSKO_03848 [Bryopsis sp. KO-2023]